MSYRSQGLEIDDARREIRTAERTFVVQPKIFDLLLFLAKNEDRVVPKRELLDTVWPDVTVSEASLQRVVSLARSTLADAGYPDAVRTFARQGYRFCLRGADGVLVRAEAAYARGDWESAIRTFREVDAVDGLSGQHLQQWAHAAQCLARPSEALPALERAVAAFAAAGEARRAAWAALLCASLRVEWAELSLANGWLQRAATLLEGEPACRERGYLEMMRCRVTLRSKRTADALTHALNAREAGRAFGDSDLEGIGLSLAGQAWLILGETQRGLDALDEAGAAVIASGLSPWAGGLVYCGVIHSHLTRADWQRAGEWTEQFTRWCESYGAPAYPGLCRMHRAEVLMVRGQLVEAERELHATIETLTKYTPWTVGDAWNVLGEIQLARGSFRDALASYQRASEHGYDSCLGQALVRFYEGDVERAARQLEQSMHDEGFSFRSQRGMSLAWLALASAAAGKLEPARDAIERLTREPELVSTPSLAALVARARAEMHSAEGDRAGAIKQLRVALRMLQTMGAPLPAAEVRRKLAVLLHADGDRESAELELRAAINVFQRAGADGQVALCERDQRSMGTP